MVAERSGVLDVKPVDILLKKAEQREVERGKSGLVTLA